MCVFWGEGGGVRGKENGGGLLGDRGACMSPGMPEGELFWRDRLNSIFGYFIGGGDEYMGLAGGLNTKGGPWTSCPWLVTLAWCAEQGCRRCWPLSVVAKSLRDLQTLGNCHHKPSCATWCFSHSGLFSIYLFSPQTGKVHGGESDLSKSALTSETPSDAAGVQWSCGCTSGLS